MKDLIFSKLQYSCCLLILFLAISAHASSESKLGISPTLFLNGKNDFGINLFYEKNRFVSSVGFNHAQDLALESSSNNFNASLNYKVIEFKDIDVEMGIGVVGNKPYLNYLADFEVNNRFSVQIGNRYLVSNDQDVNEYSFFLGFRYYLNQPDPVFEIKDNTDKKIAATEKKKPVEIPVVKKEKLPNPYIVKEGEWLLYLQRKYQFDVSKMLRLNDIKDPELIYPGQVIYYE